MLLVEVPAAKNLSNPLGRITKACGQGSPIEGCVLLEADADGLMLVALNTHTHQLRLRVPEANVIDSGKVLMTAELLKQMSSKLGDGAVNLALDDGRKCMRVSADTDLELVLYKDDPGAFPLERELPPVVGVVDAYHFGGAIDRALKMLEDGEFITFVAKGDQLLVYTRSRGTLYSRTALELQESTGDFEIAIPKAVFAHLPPKLVGPAYLRLHPDLDSFAVSTDAGEHLLLKQVANDTTSLEVESWVSMPSADYFALAADALLRDLDRAASFKSIDGVKLERDRNVVVASCKSSTMGSMKTRHKLLDAAGDIPEVSVDAAWMEAAVRALDAHEVVLEVLREEANMGGGLVRENIWLRLRNRENPDHRVVVIPTLV